MRDKRSDVGSERSIYVEDLAYDVIDTLLQKSFGYFVLDTHSLVDMGRRFEKLSMSSVKEEVVVQEEVEEPPQVQSMQIEVRKMTEPAGPVVQEVASKKSYEALVQAESFKCLCKCSASENTGAEDPDDPYTMGRSPANKPSATEPIRRHVGC
ncbi:hypothetical protein C5167_034312 [Papaver somniferum]|uniref:Uncharacterized protein n=1 Tax=Papaver somniferum TaxID=3469 RepID=A0A4Y7KFK5_PAPSO|nr:hypothetical protein C5167_034312 [Papaver somniferum]